jgi:hypothetical protein
LVDFNIDCLFRVYEPLLFFCNCFFYSSILFLLFIVDGKKKNADKILCYDVYQFTVGGIDISSGLYKAVFWTARE